MSVKLQLKRADKLKRQHFIEVQGSLESHPEWMKMREVIAEALEPYPEARYAVAEALMHADERMSV